MRLASLTPSNTEIVVFLGRQADLVGVDTWSDWPPGLWDGGIEDLGPDLHIEIDRLGELEPDLVLAAESVPGMEPVVERVQDAGLETLVLAPRSMDEVLEDVERVGRAIERAELARSLAGAMRKEVERIEQLTDDRASPRVLWEWWPRPVIVAGGGGWMVDVVEASGGTLSFGERAEQSLDVELEEIQEAAPDVLALCWQGTLHERQDPAHVHGREGWSGVPAVRNDRILSMPESLFGRPGPRLVEGTRLLAEHLHPELGGALGPPYAWVPKRIREEGGLDALGGVDRVHNPK